MRITVTIADDVLAAARVLAEQKKVSLGNALSDLARRGLKSTPASESSRLRGQFAVLADAQPITSEDVYRSLSDWPKKRQNEFTPH